MHARRVLRWRRLASACLYAVALAALLLLLAAGGDRVFSLQESRALQVFAAAAGVGLLLLAAAWLRALFRHPSIHELAVAVENRRPELMDALACAVEVETRPADQRGRLEAALLETMTADAAALDFVRLTTPPELRWRRLLPLAAVSVGLAALALQTEVAAKALYRVCELRNPAAAGLAVTPGTLDVPVRTDVTVRATVRRWQRAADIVCRDSRGLHRYPMTREATEGYTFTFFSVEERTAYRVETPSLQSAWFELRPYTPPVLRTATLRLVPPAYTGRKSLEFSPPQDTRAPEGSALELHATTDPGVSAEFVLAGVARPMLAGTAAGNWVYRDQVTKTIDGLVRLRNAEGRTAESAPFRVEALPDQPPVVEFITPVEDTETQPGAALQVEARAVDDYSISEVSFSYAVAGGKRETVRVFGGPSVAATKRGPARQDVTVGWLLDTAEIKAQNGDVITCYFTAADNRAPQRQQARSQLLFVTVRETPKPKEGGQKDGAEMKQMDLSGLIAEAKRLLRLSYDILNLPAEGRAQPRGDLLTGLRELRLELQKKTREIEQVTGGGTGDPVSTLLEAANDELEGAENLVRRELVDESVPPQERALTRLIQAENELLKNAMTAMAQQGKKMQQQQGQQQKSGDESQAEKQRRQQGLDLARLKETMEKLRDLARRQQDLNDQLARLPEENADRGVTAEGARRERGLQKEVDTVAADLGTLPPASRAAAETEAAGASMAAAARGLEANKPGDARREGQRAQGMLQAAIQSLESLYRKAVAENIGDLAQMAKELAAAERREAGANRELAARREKVPDAEANVRRAEQQKLQQVTQELDQGVRSLSAAVEEQFPDVSGALGESLAFADEQNLDGTMTKAGNAVQYRRFEKAQGFQNDAAKILDQVAGKLEGAAQKLPAISREELREALAQIQQARLATRDAAQNPSAQEGLKGLQSIQQRLAGDLDRLATGMRDQELKGISDALNNPLGDSANSVAGRLDALLAGAARLVEQRLMQLELRQRLTLNRRHATVPDQYRKLIENYFKSLSEGE